MKWRLIQSGYLDGYTNMAVDEAMFTLMAGGAVPPTLRLYGWRPAAITIGYFQKPEDTELAIVRSEKGLAADVKIDIIKRLTGGGAIFHDQELTFCLAADLKKTIIPEDIFESYEFISQAVINGLENLGVYARMRGEEVSVSEKKAPADKGLFFCFDRSSKYDIIYKGKKLAGSAQRRKQGILMHHGSILLDGENPKTSISVNSILSRKVEFEEFSRDIIHGFEKKLSANLAPGELTTDEQKLSRELIKNKYTDNNALKSPV